ncbi:hypothetical protein D3C84_1024160 [compost metagenome]
MTVPATEYTSASQTIEPAMLNSRPPRVKLKVPDRPHRMPTKLASVTTAFSRPMDRFMV